MNKKTLGILMLLGFIILRGGHTFAGGLWMYAGAIPDMGMELNNQVRKDNVPACDMTVLHGKTIPNNGILIATRAHVHTDQRQHLKKDDEPEAYVDDDNNDDKEEKKEGAAIEEKKDDPAEPVTDQEEEKDTVEE
jgi:hypothetical protein